MFITKPQASPFFKLLATPQAATWLLAAMYIVGFIGLQLALTRPYFEVLVPFNLVATLFILLNFHSEWHKPFVLWAIAIALAGFGVEVAGVHTQAIFGAYQYEHNLGLKLWGVPIVIACNWLFLIYATGIIAQKYVPYPWLKPIAAAALMTALDFFVEPVAIKYYFWRWQGGTIPLQNYVAWFAISWLMHLAFYATPFNKNNPLAIAVYFLNLAFFVAHYILL